MWSLLSYYLIHTHHIYFDSKSLTLYFLYFLVILYGFSSSQFHSKSASSISPKLHLLVNAGIFTYACGAFALQSPTHLREIKISFCKPLNSLGVEEFTVDTPTRDWVHLHAVAAHVFLLFWRKRAVGPVFLSTLKFLSRVWWWVCAHRVVCVSVLVCVCVCWCMWGAF